MLRKRTGVVLRELVDEYIATASPVPSKTLVQKSGLKVSPATMRNEMAELEEAGYILRPHVSAGAVPSDLGYRFYVDTLESPEKLSEEARARIRLEFAKAERDVEAWTRLAAHLLASLVGDVAIVTFPRSRACRLKRIELVYLRDFLALLVVVLQEARLRQRMVPLSEVASQDDLVRVANKLNHLFSGLQEREITSRQAELTPTEQRVMENALSMLKDAEAEATEPCVDGLRYLLNQPEFAFGGLAGEAVEVLENHDLLRSILVNVGQEAGVRVTIGAENGREELRAFSLVLCRYGEPDGPFGVIGVLGPTRLEYQTAIGGVRFLSGLMADLVSSVRV